MRFYTTEKLGPKQSLTPEGFLLCEDVPIARTGEMHYGPGETPIEPGPQGFVKVIRDAVEVFRAQTVASYAGKPVVNDHPPEEVRPDNWRMYSVGTVLHPRRGEGAQSELLLADLLIYDPMTIEDVRAGKREVSCGYDADYEETAPGEGKQVNMIGNHVALVDSGRCGPRCAIGDRKTVHQKTGDSKMPKVRDRKALFLDTIRRAWAAKDEKELENVLQEAGDSYDELPPDPDGDGDEHIHIHANGAAGDRRMTDEDIENRFQAHEARHDAHDAAIEELRQHTGFGKDATDPANAADPANPDPNMDSEAEEEIEGNLQEEAPAGTTDAMFKATKDSSLLSESFQETVAMAEILVPGIMVPTFDARADRRKTFDSICSLRRSALGLAYATSDGKAIIDQVFGKPLDLAKMACRDVRTLFRATAGVKKASNNRATDHLETTDHVVVAGPIRTAKDLNRLMREHYKAR